MAANKEMIDAFVDGRLSADDHELMVHHISSCTECAGAVIAALAEAARALSESSERMSGGWSAASAGEGQLAFIEASAPAAEPQPAVDLLQLDLVMDHSAGSASDSDLLLRPEKVQEIALDELPTLEPAAAQAPPLNSDAVGSAADFPQESDAAAIASVTAAGIAESVAHGAAALASMAHQEALEELPESTRDAAAEASVEAVPPAAESVDVESVAEPVTAALFETILLEPVAEPVEPLTANGHVDSPILEPEPALLADAAPAIPEDSRADRIPESERVAIAMAARLGSEMPLAAPRRWTVVLPAAFAFLLFAALAAVAAVQLREFAALNEGAPTAADPMEPVATVALGPVPSVLAGALDSAVYGAVVDLTDLQDSLVAVDRAVIEAAAAAGAEGVGDTAAASLRDPTPSGATTARIAEGASSRPSPGARPAQQGGARADRGISPAAPDAADAPRLLRTTTHRPRPDSYLVLREYDTSAPAPAPRPGVNEYRWRDAEAGRLYVLSGTVAVADLRAYGRQLQNGRGQ